MSEEKTVIINKIKELISMDKVAFKKHAIVRMVERDISAKDITTALNECDLIKTYKQDRPLISYLVLGYSVIRQPLHILIAIDEREDILWIITVYQPDKSLWSTDYTRKDNK